MHNNLALIFHQLFALVSSIETILVFLDLPPQFVLEQVYHLDVKMARRKCDKEEEIYVK